MNEQIQAAIKEFFEDSLVMGAVFHMGELYEFVASQYDEANIADLGKAMESMKARGEIAYAPHSVQGQTQYYSAQPPTNPQSTMFGAPSGGGPKKKSKSFTKKQKGKALAALDQIMASMPHYPQEFQKEHASSLERLQEWLKEQVNK